MTVLYNTIIICYTTLMRVICAENIEYKDITVIKVVGVCCFSCDSRACSEATNTSRLSHSRGTHSRNTHSSRKTNTQITCGGCGNCELLASHTHAPSRMHTHIPCGWADIQTRSFTPLVTYEHCGEYYMHEVRATTNFAYTTSTP